jgi:hypothetical protein
MAERHGAEHLIAAEKDHSRRADWWYVDSKGRKIGYMWPEDLLAILESIWGWQKGIKNFAIYTGFARPTVEKYCNGKLAIPKHIAALALNMQEVMLAREAHKKVTPWRAIPRVHAEWLPEDRQEETFKVPTKPFG